MTAAPDDPSVPTPRGRDRKTPLARARKTPLAHRPDVLQAARERKMWTISELARRVGCSPSTISEAELGTRGMSLTLLRKVARELSVPLSSLQSGEGRQRIR